MIPFRKLYVYIRLFLLFQPLLTNTQRDVLIKYCNNSWTSSFIFVSLYRPTYRIRILTHPHNYIQMTFFLRDTSHTFMLPPLSLYNPNLTHKILSKEYDLASSIHKFITTSCYPNLIKGFNPAKNSQATNLFFLKKMKRPITLKLI